MDQQRGYADDGNQRWYGGDPDWERGRHGAPPAEEDTYDSTARYQGQSLFEVGPRSGEPMPPRPGDPPTGGIEVPRRSAEAIDVGALRRSAEASPGFVAPDYQPNEFSGYPAVPAPPPDAPMAPAAPVSGPMAGPVAGPGDGPGGLEGLGFGGVTYQSGAPNPVSAPTAAHNTVGGTYRSRRPVVTAGVAVVAGLLEVVALRLLVDVVFTSNPSVAATAAAIFLALGVPMFAIGVHGLLGGAAGAGVGWRVWSRAPLVYLPVGIVLFVCAALAA